MQWIVNIAIFLLLSELLLELVSDTKYARFARWVSGVILLLLFLKLFTETNPVSERFKSSIQSFQFAIGTERIPEELYLTEKNMENSVLISYKESVREQIERILEQNQMLLRNAQMQVMTNGELEWIYIEAQYVDGKERESRIAIPTVEPVEIGEQKVKNMFSPMELYIRETLAEFYQMDVNKIEVVIEEAD